MYVLLLLLCAFFHDLDGDAGVQRRDGVRSTFVCAHKQYFYYCGHWHLIIICTHIHHYYALNSMLFDTIGELLHTTIRRSAQ